VKQRLFRIANPKGLYAALLASMVLLSMGGCADRKAQADSKRTAEVVNDPVKEVTVTQTKTSLIEEVLTVNGNLATDNDVSVGAKNPGRIQSVLVRDGDQVSAGQLLATMDISNLLAQQAQALAQLKASQAQLSQAQNSARLAPARTDASVRQAEAGVRQAKAQLAKAEAGARSEEKAQAAANVASAKSNLETQKKELERVKTLVAEGALAESRLDQQRNAYESALAQYQSSLEAQAIAANATRPEDLASARESVRQAEQILASAKASKKLDVTLDDQVDAARAQVEASRAALGVIQQSIRDAQIVAPISGKVVGKPTLAGTVVGAGNTIVRLIGSAGVFFEAEVPSEELSKVQVGTSVRVAVDAFAGRTFSGTVAFINPLADSVGRLFKVRVQITGADQELKPGMFAKGEIVTKSVPGAVVLPSSAVVRRGSDVYVMVIEGDVAKKQTVRLGITKNSLVQVIGLAEGVTVVLNGQEDIVEGSKVRVASGKSEGAEGAAKS